MFKGNKKYIIVLVLCFLALILLKIYSPKPIDWSLSYSKKDKIPYGTKALYDAITDIYSSIIISTEKAPLYNILKNNSLKNTNYLLINESFEPDDLDTKELLKFVTNGNTAFISANYFSGKFADTLKISTDAFYNYDDGFSIDSSAINNFTKKSDSIQFNFSSPSLHSEKFYQYSKQITNTYFTSFDTTVSKILGITGDDEINFIEMKFGKGKIYIHSTPEVFTNYFFTDEPNSEYVYKCLSYLALSNLIWDEYYKVGNVQNDNMLRVLFANTSLKTAYFVALISLLLFILIGIKRKQRIIPIIEPMRNTTLDFVDVVGTLYYQSGNHKNIADKKIAYFLEYIRKTFQVKTTIYDDLFINRISVLSGIELEKIHKLFYYFSDITVKDLITENELGKLNAMIEEFHTYNKR